MAKHWIGTPPTKCDICQQPFGTAFVDGVTASGQWGMLCLPCHRRNGGKLGIGLGQMYSTTSPFEKVK